MSVLSSSDTPELVLEWDDCPSDDCPLDNCMGYWERCEEASGWCGGTIDPPPTATAEVVPVMCVSESTLKPNTCLVGITLFRGDMSPFLGDLYGKGGGGWVGRRKRKGGGGWVGRRKRKDDHHSEHLLTQPVPTASTHTHTIQ